MAARRIRLTFVLLCIAFAGLGPVYADSTFAQSSKPLLIALEPLSSADPSRVEETEHDSEGVKRSLRAYLETQQTAHDKVLVDRFLLGVAVVFTVISAVLLFSLPPRQNEQKG